MENPSVLYCNICTLPVEYCEFGNTVQKCKDWLKATNPLEYVKLYSNEAILAKQAALTSEAQQREARDAQKKAQKAVAVAEREQAQKFEARVVIRRIDRQRKKFVTVITGLDVYSLDLKKVSKEIGRRFATGASVTKSTGSVKVSLISTDSSTANSTSDSGTFIIQPCEEIHLQGDLCREVCAYLQESYKDRIPSALINLATTSVSSTTTTNTDLKKRSN